MTTTPTSPTTRIAFSGAPGSPYTRKMLALLRYRHVPYRYLVNNDLKANLPVAKPALLPTFYLPGEGGALQAVTDSTPLIRRLETVQTGRAVVPNNPVLALLDCLLEDYADEWLTKPMFHYRWAFPADVDRASRIVPLPMNIQASDDELAWVAQAFGGRQVSRLGVVGSNPGTAPLIEASYTRLLSILERHLASNAFLMGRRPGASDFALYGQLSQLALFDPTPMALTCQTAPRVVAWTQLVEDLSGLEPSDADWLSPTALPPTLTELLAEMGRTYVPVMLANEQALQAGSKEVNTEVDGKPWVQQTFPYQAKCLGWLRRDFAELNAQDQAQFMSLLNGTGCERLFADRLCLRPL
ncbi:MAG TPA: glutathione S-transferase N-terminal domain-containing protein [Limnobacter sp.]|uniref:glutathione S-transferase N-terminal domain-containing protein n=1 Tax=Limnobacter sp. TaxID=2003368 RepID=UPI002EDB9CA1